MFPHQRDLTAWALRLERSAIFADTGLGKSRPLVAWADTVHRETGSDMLIACAARRRRANGRRRKHQRCRDARPECADVRPGITITGYDRLHKFDVSRFGGVVLDESSIIKHRSENSATLLNAFGATPYKALRHGDTAPTTGLNSAAAHNF